MTIRPILLVACVLAAAPGCNDSSASAVVDANLFTVIRRNLPITIKEQAELQAIRETVVRSEVEGQATIIYLMPEGKIVDKGEKLVELDCSDLVEKHNSQKITVGKADASLVQAKKAGEILQKELRAKRNTAESNLRITEMELEKFLGREKSDGPIKQGKNSDMVKKLRELVSAPQGVVATKEPAKGEADDPLPPELVSKIDPAKYQALVTKVTELLELKVVGAEGTVTTTALERDMGEMANKVLQQIDKIRLAMADLKYQEAYFVHSSKLAKKQFYTQTELEKDAIDMQRKLSVVGLAWNDLDLLINYSLSKDKIKLEQDVENARIELERVIATNEAEVIKSDSDLRSKKEEFELVQTRLETLARQIRNAIIVAPTPGLVIYARTDRNSRNSESIKEGSQVRERQDLIILPDTTRMQAIAKVQEAVVAQVRNNQRAHIEVEAQPNRVFRGFVSRVAQQADSNQGWSSNDRKVYTTVIEFDDDNSDGTLKARNAAAVTIMVDELKDVLVVPLQAVRRDRSVNYVWRSMPGGPEAVPVKTGRHNAEHIVVEDGIVEKEVVYLAPPPGASVPTFPQPELPVTAPPPDQVASNGDHANGQGGPENGNGGGRRRGGAMDDEAAARMAAWRQNGEDVKAWLLQKYPDRADDIGDNRLRREMMADTAVQDALKADNPGLFEKWREVQEIMKARGGQGPGGKGQGGQGGQGKGRGGRGGE